MKFFYHYLLFLTFNVGTILSHGQERINKDGLVANINIAFNSLEEIDSLYFDYQIKQEFISDYLKYFGEISPKSFNNEKNAKNLIFYYSTPNGIKDLLLEYIKTMSQNYDEMFSFGMEAYMKVYFSSDNEAALMRPNSLNKYAILLPIIVPENNEAHLYLNSKFICVVKQAKNGVRVHSGKEYQLEFKMKNIICCKESIIFNNKEERIVECKITD